MELNNFFSSSFSPQQVDDIFTKILHPKEYAWSSKHNRSKSHQQQSTTPHRNDIYYGLPVTNTAQEPRGKLHIEKTFSCKFFMTFWRLLSRWNLLTPHDENFFFCLWKINVENIEKDVVGSCEHTSHSISFHDWLAMVMMMAIKVEDCMCLCKW